MKSTDLRDGRGRVVTFDSLIRTVSLVLLIALQIGIVGFMTIWAIGGLLHLDWQVSAGLGLILAVPSLWVIWRTAVWVYAAETDPQNN
ncbi:hypothetical protein H2509_07130 [Stappia sp. F7233]|uniref:Uncharacterized protein n=1 Tax=Stappia albiluteola TaxID=2758565 RepID=A0A839ABU9_9HYPH|nr:hypothetical protein [Stappia albiluteola]MBA5776901.1 hypothetical protein [Stappia albiluteola]